MNDDVNGIIEIRDPEIDAEAIMLQIRGNLRARRLEAEAQGLDFEQLAKGEFAKRFGDGVYQDMRQVSASASQMGVQLSVVHAQRKIPIVSALIQRVRQALHQLVIYYVNQLAAQQNHHNRQIVGVLMRLVLGLEREPYPEVVETLQEQVAALHEDIARLTALVEAHSK